MNGQWRLELFFKSGKELQDRVIPFLKESGIKCVNLTNKTKDDDLLGSCQAICRAVPSANICAHYSLKYNYHTNAERTYEAFRDFCTDMAALDGRAAVMLISGGGKKRKLDTVRALEMAQKDKRFPKHLPLYVCFNPYFPDDADLAAERHRLKQKLEQGTGLITGIYLQTGTDLKRLEDGLRLLWEVVGQRVQGDGLVDMELLGSVFLPTKRLLAQMKYRPWNGVFLSDTYLSSVEAAEGITASILHLYHQYGVQPLVESNITTAAELRRCHALLDEGICCVHASA